MRAPTVDLGPFQLHAAVAHGGMGAIWRGTHRPTGLPVAVKILAGPASRTETYQRQFRHEVRAVARLDHPHVVLVFDHGRLPAPLGDLPAGAPYLVMEWASGGSLSQAPAPRRWEEVRAVLVAILDALGHAHARGVLHRDLKPDNVLVCGPGDRRPGLKLADFGLAMALDTDGVELRLSGTPRYMAPEQFEGAWRDYGPPTDLYALGGMAWQWVTGRPLFEARTPVTLARAHLLDPLPSLAPRFPVPAGLAAWLGGLLAKDPAARPPTVAHALAALRALGPATEGPSTPAPPPSQVDTWVFRDWSLATDTTPVVDPEAETVPVGPPEARPAWPPPLVEHEPTPGPVVGGEAPPLPVRWPPRVRLWDRAQLLGAGVDLFRDRRLPLVGRGAERDALWAAAVDARATGRPVVVHLVGPEGSGTGTLVEWLAEQAAELGGARVLRVPPTGGLAAVLLERLRGWGLDAEALAERAVDVLEAEGIDVPALAARLAEAAVGRGDAVDALARLIARLAGARPDRLIVLAVPRAEGLAVGSLVRRLRALGALGALPLVVAVAGEVDAEDPLQGDVRRLPVGPLSPAETERLAIELLGLGPVLAGRITAASGGLPGVVEQIVADLVEAGRLVDGPEGFEVADDAPLVAAAGWGARLAVAVPEPGLRVALEALAALDGEVPPSRWAALRAALGHPPQPGDLDRLAAGRLVVVRPDGRVRLADPRLRAAVVDGARRAGRWSATCAAAVSALQAASEPVPGALLVEAGRAAEALWPLLHEALALAGTFRYREALARLDQARRVAEAVDLPDGDLGWARLDGIEAHVRLNRWDPGPRILAPAHRLEARARRYGWSDEIARALRTRGAVGVWHGQPEQIEACFAEALTCYPEDRAETVLYRGICLEHLGHAARFRGDAERAAALYGQTLSLGEAHDLGWLRAKAHAGFGQIALAARDADAALAAYGAAIAEITEDIAQDGSAWRFNAGRALVMRGDVDAAERLYDELVSEGLARLGVVQVLIGTFGQLLCAASRGDWVRWPTLLARARDLSTAHDLASPDFNVLLDEIVDQAAAAGRAEEARELGRLVAATWRRIGWEDHARDVEARLPR